jgi:hypothetical protein
MTYILSTQTGGTLDGFGRVETVLGPDVPAGLIARYVGTNETGLSITTVWASKADSDRFSAERLFPALREVFGEEPGEPVAMIDFVAVDDLVIEVAR